MRFVHVSAACLLLFLSIGGVGIAQSAEPSKAQTVEIVLDSFSFTPKTLHLKQGEAYTLHFVNKSNKSHNFDSPSFFAALNVAPGDMAKVGEGKIELGGGESADVKAVASKPGTYNFKCSHFLHASFGMTGQAIIE